MKKTLLILISVATIGLSACSALVVGGVAAGGLSILDRRSTGAQADDQVMELAIRNQANTYLNKIHAKDNANTSVSVVSYNRNILLLGTVSNEEEKLYVNRIAKSQTPAKQIYNYIQVTQTPNANRVASDSWITSKIRTTLLNPKGFNPNQIKVVTYDGVTYAMGILTPQEQEAATEVIRTTHGVNKVVTLYESFQAIN